MAASEFAQTSVEKREKTFKIKQQQNIRNEQGGSEDFQTLFER